MNVLGERIARLIRSQGPISVAQFMTFALYDSVDGYYAKRDPIGARGDFITAPEISQIFGELLGLWIVQTWRDQGCPSSARLVELGPGRGTLMADTLRAARLDPEFLASIEVVLIESSPRLREAQRQRLAQCGVPICWLDRFDEHFTERPLFLLANEFFDALPIRQFVFTEHGWCERMVETDDGGLRFALSQIPVPLHVPAERGTPVIGDVYETCPSGESITESVATVIAAQSGAALIIDYGYGSDAALGETLQAVSQHKFASVLENPGEADLSAHVDFSGLARSAERGGARAYGPVDQGALLQSLGIAARAERLIESNPDQREAIAAAVERLVSPLQMGSLFKTLAIVPKHAPAPPGF